MTLFSSKIKKTISRVFAGNAKKVCALALSACCLAPVAVRAQGGDYDASQDPRATFEEIYRRGYEAGQRQAEQDAAWQQEEAPQTIWDRSQARQQGDMQEQMEYWENRSVFDPNVQIIEKYPGKRDLYIKGRPVLRENHWQKRYERLTQ